MRLPPNTTTSPRAGDGLAVELVGVELVGVELVGVELVGVELVGDGLAVELVGVELVGLRRRESTTTATIAPTITAPVFIVPVRSFLASVF